MAYHDGVLANTIVRTWHIIMCALLLSWIVEYNHWVCVFSPLLLISHLTDDAHSPNCS